MSTVARVVGYVRVSTREQGIQGFSPEVQRDAVERYAERHFGDEPYELTFFEDIGGSGGIGLRQHPDLFKKHRAGLSDALAALLADVGKRPLHFIALDQSRLERNPLLWHVLEQVYMRQQGIGFHFAQDGGAFTPGSADAMGRGVQSLANESHLQMTGKRIAQANDFRARQGYHNGRPPYGWRKGDNRDGLRWNDLEPVPELVEVVTLMKDRLLAGWGSWRVACYLEAQGIPSPSGNRKWFPEMVREIARDPVHAGYIKWKGERVKGRHYDLRLWDLEVSNEIDRVIRQRHRAAKRGVMLKDFLLAGMVTCGHCQRPVASAYDQASGGRMYRCTGRVIPTSESHKGFNKTASALETAVVEEVRRVLSTDIVHNLTRMALQEASEAEQAAIHREERRLRHEFDEAGQNLAETIQQYRKGQLNETAYQAVKRNFELTMERVEKRLAEVRQRREYLAGNALRLARAREAVTRFCDLWDHLDVEERRGLLQALLADIVVVREGRNLRLRLVYHFLPETERLLRPVKGSPGGEGAERLSQRELAILHLRQRGLSDHDIAAQLDVTWNCVRQVYYSVRRRLNEQNLEKCCQLARARIEEELPFLPLQGRLNRRAGEGLHLSHTERQVQEAQDAGEDYDTLAKRAGKPRASLYNAAASARKKRAAGLTMD